MLKVSPTHQIRLDEAFHGMLERPPEHDYVLRRLSEKQVNGEPLIQGELIIAGRDTREAFPRAREYPVHFRKTYYPICFHQDPAEEFAKHEAASELIDVPPPIGSTRTTFRSCFLPGVPFSRLSPFGVEPEERNITIAEGLDTAAAVGLWTLLEGVHDQVTRLHAGGVAHGDLYLHNVIVAPSPLAAHLIDFELAVLRDRLPSGESWEQICERDCAEILRQAIYLQCTLGRQIGRLAEASFDAMPEVIGDPARFQRAIDRQAPTA